MKRTTKWAAVAATAIGLVLGGGSFASADIKIGNRSQFSQGGESSSLAGAPATTTYDRVPMARPQRVAFRPERIYFSASH